MDVVLAISFLIFIIVTIIIMFYLRNKISKMDIKKLKKLSKIIGWSTLLAVLVSIFGLCLITNFIDVKNEVHAFIVIEISFIFICIFALLITTKFAIIDLELHKKELEHEKQKKTALLANTEKQVKIKAGYNGFTDSFLFRSLLKGATTTVKRSEEKGKVILRFEMISDEGKPFFKTLEIDEDEIINDLEIL